MRTTSALAIVAILLVSCGTPATSPSTVVPRESPDEPSPTASAVAPSATTSPSDGAASSSSPTAIPTPTAATFDPDSIAEVVVSDLVVRSAPGVDSATSSILGGRLRTGDRLFVVRGPTPASGYDWHLVAPLARADGTMGPFGWVAAASREGETWIEPSPPACPPTPDLQSVLALQPFERLACFGRESMTLEASFGGCGAGGGPWAWEPGWLMELGGCSLALDEDGDPSLLVRVPPGGTGLSGSLPAVVRGHFDDPAAAGCSVTTTDPLVPPPGPDEAVVLCRSQFVVED